MLIKFIKFTVLLKKKSFFHFEENYIEKVNIIIFKIISINKFLK